MIVSFISFVGNTLRASPDTILIPIGMLVLFVFSAALTGYLFLGNSILLYLEGKKKEAVSLIAWTFVFLFVIAIIIFLAMVLIRFN